MPSPSPCSFLPPLPSVRSACRSTPAYRHIPYSSNSSGTQSHLLQLQLEASPLVDVPLGAPIVVLVAVLLAFFAQSWINSLLGGDQGLGAFLSDGTGYNKSGFKPRRRPITDERAVPGDATKPLGGPDPLPWLKLPELDFVDVAGQPKKPKRMEQQPIEETLPSSTGRDESEKVILKLESLREQMKMEVDKGNLESAKRIENELLRLMKEKGFDFS